ncbi:hypothetical protein [Frankia nepalensis]|uniref:Uncharacterized protein n=1 Tax=Frankia nepalensis TaxID=1836974 RepID=A0A937UUR2_9ACTN|nr:hypothetical protein [Frankia nepalensis]MBL7502248.1 hypothetical protein [Frankia nepalensis]MBL7515937.1 hypothetical protein [Frankia nepalensis]MBL7632520.1 hypothetical protein [Frankia nepalensis]
MSSGGVADGSSGPPAADEPVAGPWLACPWCSGIVPLAHLVPSDEELGAWGAVCDGCGRRVSFLPPEEP